MSNNLIYTLIDRWLNGTCTNEEKEQLKTYFLQYGLTEEQLVDDPLYHPTKDQSELIYARLKEKLNIPAETVNMRTDRKWLLRIAAVVIPLMIMTAVFYFANRHPEKNGHAVTASLKQIRNTGKDPLRVQLPDGSQVWLNMYSRLEFDPQQFNSTERLVNLSGEGYFEVVPAVAAGAAGKKIPFIVETGSLRTHVLGTAFNIEAYAQESEVRVSLVHGKIALDDTATDRTTVLSPNNSLRYSKQTQTWQVLPVEAAHVALWTKGHLVFNEVPLAEAIERIRERYQVTIEYDPALLQHKRITASFENSTWPTVLANILFVHDLHYKKMGEKVVIRKKA